MESLVCNRVPEGECEFIQVIGEGGGRERKKHGECLAFYTHLQGEQDLACSTNGSMAKPVAFAYRPTCHLRVKGQPTPNAAM